MSIFSWGVTALWWQKQEVYAYEIWKNIRQADPFCKIIGYFSKDLYRLAFQYDLAFGILRIILGIIFCTHTAGVVNLFFTAMGILVLVDGLFRIQLAVDAREFGISQWWLLLMIAVITGLFGVLLLLRSAEGMQPVMLLLGCSMFSEGILNLCVALCTTRVAAGLSEK